MKTLLNNLSLVAANKLLIWWSVLGYETAEDAEDDGKSEEDLACPFEWQNSKGNYICYRLIDHTGDHIEYGLDYKASKMSWGSSELVYVEKSRFKVMI